MKSDETDQPRRTNPDDTVRAVGNLAGEVVHALRNPLAAFTTSLDLLLSGRLDADDVQSIHRVLRNELRKMDEMLQRTRELTRLHQLERVPADLAAIVRERLDARTSDLASANIRLERDVPGEPLRIVGDASLLEALVDALLQNAVDAMQSTGGILGVRLAVDDGRAVLHVRDTGTGIAEHARANVFRLFYSTRSGAAGMGLPLARWIAYGHGGNVSLTFGERGTEAVFSMPIEP